MNDEKTKQNLEYIKDYVIIILLSICCLTPIFRQFKFTLPYALDNEYILLKSIGFTGILFLIGYFFVGMKKCDNNVAFLKQNLPIILFICYMLWTFISCIMSPNQYNAFNGTINRKDGYLSYIAYGGIFSLALCLKSEKLKKYLLNFFVLISIIVILLVEVATNFNLDNIFWANDISRAVFYNLNHFGYYLLIATSIANWLFITEKNKHFKIFYCIVYSFLLYYLIINDTFGCYLALIATLIIYLITLILKKEKIRYVLISILLFILMSGVSNISTQKTTSSNFKGLSTDINNIINAKSDNNNSYLHAGSGRLEIWLDGLKFFSERPMLGYGPENLRPMYEAKGIDQDRPHNVIIQQLTTSGLPGCILYFTALGIILLRGLKLFKEKESIHTICLFTSIAYLISAMFGNSMYYTSPYFFIVLGLLMNGTLNMAVKKEGK